MITYKGINYDIGTRTLAGGLTRELFDNDTVIRELTIIRQELHCNAVRISGLPVDRLVKAAQIALELGLIVWFSPAMHYDNQQDTLKYIIDCAVAAEELRTRYGNIIFVTGCELSLFTAGFVNGDTGERRIKSLFSPASMIKNLLGIPRSYNSKLNQFLQSAVTEIRKRFHGQITYASGTWEKIDWNLFDLIGIDHYRAAYNKAIYLKQLQKYKALGKPLCIMEFGCCTYQGAGDKGPMGWAIVDWKKNPPQLNGNYHRDESEQAKYLSELLQVFNAENVYAAFAFTFVMYSYPYDEDPWHDLDMASYGAVKVLKGNRQGYNGLPWKPKQAFFELADLYKSIDTP